MSLSSFAIATVLGAVTAASNALSETAGYFEIQPGVYGKFCSECVDQSQFYSEVQFIGLEVWCKDKNCGTTYAEVNWLKDDVAVDKSNELMTLGYGEKALMVFSTRRMDVNGYRLADFSAHGF